MPKLNGYEVLSKIREMKPDIPFIFISGYQSSAMNDVILCDNTRQIPKPFDYVKLSQMVNEMVVS